MKYKKYQPGEWVRPQRKGYRLKCCDCGLVHDVDFRLVHYGCGHEIQFRMFRNNRATAAARRSIKRSKDIASPQSASQIRKEVGVTKLERSSARAASVAAKVLRDPKGSKTAKVAAGLALTQRSI